jgi:hypothetical protein
LWRCGGAAAAEDRLPGPDAHRSRRCGRGRG